MLRKVLKWLPVLAATTITFSLYAAADAPSAEEVAVGQRFAQRPQSNTNGNTNSGSCQQPAPCAPPPPACKPCCVPAKVCPMPPCDVPCYNPCCPPLTVYNHNVNPPSRCTADNNDFMIMVDFLWWRADEPETPYGYVNTSATKIDQGYITNVNYKWKPGFRLVLGWDTGYDGWDFGADWVWYRNSSKSSVEPGTMPVVGGVASPFGVHPPILNFLGGSLVEPALGTASARWKLLYNMFDLELGKGYYVSCGFVMRPYVSVRGGWINRRLSVSFGSADPTDLSQAAALFPNNYSAKSNYWGVGPRAGLMTEWKLGMGFEFFGNASTALLYGKNSKNTESVHFTSHTATTDPLSHLTNKKHNWRTVPNAQVVLGLGWGDCFNCSTVYFGVHVAWEANYYWNLPPFINPHGDQAGYSFAKNLDLNGLTAGVRVDF